MFIFLPTTDSTSSMPSRIEQLLCRLPPAWWTAPRRGLVQHCQKTQAESLRVRVVWEGEDEGGFGGGRARVREEVVRPNCVDRKMDRRRRGGPVVRRLRGGVNDDADVAAELGEDLAHPPFVANVDRPMNVLGE